MTRRILNAGVMGGIMLIVWTFVINVLFGFRPNIDLKKVPNESEVYEMLKNNIAETGKYVCNPPVSPGMPFPDNEPVFGIHYSGIGHGSAGLIMVIQLFIFVLSPLLATWLLSMACEDILNRYWKKVLFFTIIGIIIALFGDLAQFDIGKYSFSDVTKMAVQDVIAWTLIGLVAAWQLKPAEAKSNDTAY